MLAQTKKTFACERLSIRYSRLAGYKSSAGNPLLADFVSVGYKLERLGFTYYKGKVTIVEPLEES